MTIRTPGKITPWASVRLSIAECRAVYASDIMFLGGKTPKGPWLARSPRGEFRHHDLRTAVNLAMGEVLLKGGTSA